MPTTVHPLRFQSGFTLIELMVVLTLIGILSAMILPEMRGSLEDAVIRSSCRRWVELFETANSRAISSQERVRFIFDPGRGKFHLEHELGTREGQKRFAVLNENSSMSGEMDPRVTVTIQSSGSREPMAANPRSAGRSGSRKRHGLELANANVITFHPDGTVDPVEVVLRDPSGHGRVLRLNSITARVSIHDLP